MDTSSRYGAIFSAMAEGIIVHDADGRIYCNSSAEHALGLTVDQISGAAPIDPRWRTIHEDGSPFPAESHPGIVTLRTGKPLNNVVMGILKEDGSRTWISMSSRPIYDNGKICAVVTTLADVTRQREAEHTLRIGEERWKLAVEGGRDGVWDWNVESDEVFYSPRWKEILGFHESEIGNTRSEWEDRIHPEDKAASFGALNDHLDGKTPLYESEHRLKSKDGTWKWLYARGAVVCRGADRRPLRFVGTQTDITDRKAAEAARHEAERLYRGVFDGAVEGICRTSPDGKCLDANPAMARILGYSSADEMIASITDAAHQLWFDPDERAKHLRIFEQQDFVTGYECRFRCRDGSPVWISLNSRKVCGPDGRILWYEVFGNDITARKQAEIALRESEKRFRVLFDGAPVSLWESDFSSVKAYLDDLAGVGVSDLEAHFEFHPEDVCRCVQKVQIVDVNEMTVSLFEARTKTELLARWTEVFTEESLQVFKDGLLAVYMEQTPFRHEIPARTLRGKPLTVHLEVKPAPGFEGSWSMVLLSLVDITERRRAERALQESENLYRLLAENIWDVIWILDPETLRFRYVSPSVERLLGYKPEEIMARDMYATLAPHSAGFLAQVWPVRHEEVKRGWRRIYTDELELLCRNGATVWVEDTSHCVLNEQSGRLEIYGVSRDITERKKAQNQLQLSQQKLTESTQHFLAVASCAPVTIFSMDMSGRFTYLSPNIIRTHGYTPEEALNLNWRDTTMPRQHAATERFLEEELEKAVSKSCDRSHRMTIESEQLRKDGTTFCAEVNATFVWSEDGKPIGVIGVTQDITERKQAEAEREKLWGQLAQAQKMESIGRLAGGVAHDFNNLLTVINGYSALALPQLKPGDLLREQLEEIHKAGERAAALTRQLLAFSRKQILRPRSLDLNRVVEDIQSMLRPLVGEEVEVRLVFSTESPVIHADPHQLEQVIMNLVVNARDAMPGGGELVIETGLTEWHEDETAPCPDAKPGRYAMLAVSDTGVGMDEATLPRIYEPFFTTKQSGQGTGLGLSMVQGIVTQSGGYITVDSKPGQGTTFRIYLPAACDAEAAQGEARSQPALHGDETILVVEDQQDVRAFTATALKSYGYRVIEAASAAEALKVCERARARIDLVVTDLVMPQTGGRQLIDCLAEMRPGIKSLFMSGYTDETVVRHRMSHEEAFIQKPFSAEELAEKVREIFTGARPRILLVCDETGVRSFLRDTLESSGYTVTATAAAKEAVSLTLSARVDLVITDLILEREGVETINALRRQVPGIAIVAVSGALGDQVLELGEVSGADVVLNRPVEVCQLLATVSDILGRRKNLSAA